MAELDAGDQLAQGSQRRVKIPKLFQFRQRLIPQRVGIAVQLADAFA